MYLPYKGEKEKLILSFTNDMNVLVECLFYIAIKYVKRNILS